MRYSFNSNQIEILNILIFDSEITIDDVQNSQVVNETISFPIERLEFENVTRKKFLFWTTTDIEWTSSSLIFYNVKGFLIKLDKKSQTYNFSISQIRLNNQTQIELLTNEGLKIIIDFIGEISIDLFDIRKSGRLSGGFFGSKGLTKEEWKNFSLEKRLSNQYLKNAKC